MSNLERWCADIENQLDDDNIDKITILSDIKVYLSALPQEQASKTSRLLKLTNIFDCLNSSVQEQVDLTCDVLNFCLSNFPYGESIERYGKFLERALNHPFLCVKLVALKELLRNVKDKETAIYISERDSLVAAILVCVGDDELSIAQKASEIIINIGKTEFGLQQLLISNSRENFIQLININEIVRFRVYEIIVEISVASIDGLAASVSTGIVNKLFTELDCEDPLIKLNVLEALANLARAKHGFQYMVREEIVKKILHALYIVDEDPLSTILYPGYIRFFGHVSYWEPEYIMENYPFSLRLLCNVFTEPMMSFQDVALDTLGHIASHKEGKLALGERHFVAETVQCIGELLVQVPNDTVVRSLHCIANMLSLPIEQHSPRIDEITEDWFHMWDMDPVEKAMHYVQNPFKEICIAGLRIIKAISNYSWGQVLINANPFVLEYILSRNVPICKEAKELKYAIAKDLFNSPFLDELALIKIKDYVNEGPFYVRAETNVATEGSS